MNDASTGAMQNFRAVGGLLEPADPTAGLVVLYAENFRALPPVFFLDRKEHLLGRDESVSLHLPVSAVSRRHASLRFERGQWIVRDLGSTNGTLVDGQRIEEAILEPSAELRIGDAIFKLVEHSARAYARYSLDGSLSSEAQRLTQRGTALVGGFQMDRIAATIEQIAPSTLSVLILGESGTGKEVAARELHDKSGRPGQFFAINCAALPENLIESELFGYQKGAFSGADRDKKGLIQAAHRGTLLLDEIGDMPLSAQAKLLRVLQSKEVLPLGATRPEPVDVRIVAATHRDLTRLQKEGKFRRDLFARLHEFSLFLPPLRDRKEDLYQLIHTFLKRHPGPEVSLSFPFMTGLLHYDFPYNVRELEAFVRRAQTLVQSSARRGPAELQEEHLPESVQQALSDYASALRPPTVRSEGPSHEELVELLREEKGNIAAVGRRLGKARMQIHRYLKRYGLDIEDYR